MLFSLKLRVDAETNAFVLELENGAKVSKSHPIAHFGPGLGRTVMLNTAEDGTVTSLSIPGASEILEELAADVARDKADQAARVAAAEKAATAAAAKASDPKAPAPKHPAR